MKSNKNMFSKVKRFLMIVQLVATIFVLIKNIKGSGDN